MSYLFSANHAARMRLLSLVFLSALLSACYSAEGPVPEAKLIPQENLSWTNADVDELVERHYESISSPIDSDAQNIPAACQNIHFYRYKLKSASDNSQDADAVLLMMPGIIEGANGFHHVARQLIYMAKTQRDMNVELWAVDRRANCLEDLRGFNRGEEIADISEAQDAILGYYYNNEVIDGEQFAGFHKSTDVGYLADFGIGLATQDMFTIMQTRMPDIKQRQQKLFVGGHSLGGIHASVFLSWDQDGSLATINDAGYNNVAGVVGLDALVGDFSQAPQAMFGFLPFPELFAGLSSNFIENFYSESIKAIQQGESAAFLEVPGFFTPEILALLEPIGMLADRAPNEEFTAIKEIPQNPALNTLLNFFQARDQQSFVLGPYFADFRYTNQAMLGLLFDDDFSALNLLHISMGFMNGGAITDKSHVLQFLASFQFLEPIYSPVLPEKDLYVTADAGANVLSLGQGPLYSWANYNEVADAQNTEYTDVSGDVVFTRLEDEMTNIEDVYPALFLGESNLTEWYFPTRIVLDLFAIVYEYGQSYGLNTLHSQKINDVPALIFIAEEGAAGLSSILLPTLSGEQVNVPNMGHLDPLFAVANNPDRYKNPIMPKLLDFLEERTQELQEVD